MPCIMPPPVQFTRTRDGYDIAYTVTGRGPTVLVLPSWINHVQDVWTEGLSVASLLTDLAQRYRVVNYDSRGMGMSTRELSYELTFESYMCDLEAVVDVACPERFVVLGFSNFVYLALHYALQQPERVAALVLIDPPYPWKEVLRELNAQDNWERFLWSHTSRHYKQELAMALLEMFKRWSTQESFFASLKVWRDKSDPAQMSDLSVQSLLLMSRGLRSYEASATEFARLLPGSRLVYLESGLPYGAKGEAICPISELIDGARLYVPSSEDVADLSQREREVLALLAAGRSNAQIAEALTISLNTVGRHVSNIFGKTGVANRTEAASYAHRHGLS
jgi:DNA-binding CsgD family transcriptional regulator